LYVFPLINTREIRATLCIHFCNKSLHIQSTWSRTMSFSSQYHDSGHCISIGYNQVNWIGYNIKENRIYREVKYLKWVILIHKGVRKCSLVQRLSRKLLFIEKANHMKWVMFIWLHVRWCCCLAYQFFLKFWQWKKWEQCQSLADRQLYDCVHDPIFIVHTIYQSKSGSLGIEYWKTGRIYVKEITCWSDSIIHTPKSLLVCSEFMEGVWFYS